MKQETTDRNLDQDYFTEKQASKYCGVCLSQFRRMRLQYQIVPIRFMGKNLYRKIDLRRAIERNA